MSVEFHRQFEEAQAGRGFECIGNGEFLAVTMAVLVDVQTECFVAYWAGSSKQDVLALISAWFQPPLGLGFSSWLFWFAISMLVVWFVVSMLMIHVQFCESEFVFELAFGFRCLVFGAKLLCWLLVCAFLGCSLLLLGPWTLNFCVGLWLAMVAMVSALAWPLLLVLLCVVGQLWLAFDFICVVGQLWLAFGFMLMLGLCFNFVHGFNMLSALVSALGWFLVELDTNQLDGEIPSESVEGRGIMVAGHVQRGKTPNKLPKSMARRSCGIMRISSVIPPPWSAPALLASLAKKEQDRFKRRRSGRSSRGGGGARHLLVVAGYSRAGHLYAFR
ncbi:uncharacterized protein A4U43_C07F31520 [Asparagus officinalis]|uniref:Uncharacterized protein n=1 Tax=Asparagus officinalis TaxID=4686 RepID=A0A5P1EGF9_ASPOF|nr:uncharacterized protein A4U43_C07F31520 [Asparagus officinalis]